MRKRVKSILKYNIPDHRYIFPISVSIRKRRILSLQALLMSRLKIFFRRIHLYLGLAAGLIITVSCLTGSLLVFEEELSHLFHKQRYYTDVKQVRLSPDTLAARALQKVPGAKLTGIKIYSNPKRNTEISINKPSEKKEARPGGKKEEGTKLTVFIDPYSGEVKDVYNSKGSFFSVVEDIHRRLLSGTTGKLITGISTLIFVFILITGIVLWWPKNKAMLKSRLKIKVKANWKRVTHDYHIVLGFYTAIFLFMSAFTALAWSFEWFNKGIYTITGTTSERPKAPKSTAKFDSTRISFSDALQSVTEKISDAEYYNIAAPKDSSENFAVGVLAHDAPYSSATDTYYVDAYTGTVNSVQKFSKRNIGQKIRVTFKELHLYSIGGISTKIIGFIVCLLGAFFPVTGYIMWLNRWKKKRKAAK